MKKILAAFLLTLISFTSATSQELTGHFPPGGGNITVQPTGLPIAAGGLEFRSENNGLSNNSDAAPFQFYLTGNDKSGVGKVTMGALAPVTIDGPLTLGVSAAGGSQVSATWGKGIVPTLFPITESFGLGRIGLQGSFLYDGGAITVAPWDPLVPVLARGLDFKVINGSLTGGGSPAPFETLTTNTPEQWLASSAADVTIDGPITLDVVATSDARVFANATTESGPASFPIDRLEPSFSDALRGSFPTGGGPISIRSNGAPTKLRGLDLTNPRGTFSSDGNPSPFQSLVTDTREHWKTTSTEDVTIDGVVQLGVSLRAGDVNGHFTDGTTSSKFEILQQQAARLEGRYPFDGGPISIRSTAGPTATRMLDLTATAGTLTGGGNAAPYEALSNNTAQRWTATSAADVFIDGDVTLDVVTSSDAAIAAKVDNGFNLSDVAITRSEPNFTENIVGSFPALGGPILLQAPNGPVTTRGIDFQRSRGQLSSGGSPAPYETLTNNSEDRWTATSTIDVTIDGNIVLDVSAARNAIIDASMNDGSTTSSFAVARRQPLKLTGSFPFFGGPITVDSGSDPISLRELDISTLRGTLSGGGSAAPFANLVTNTDQQWTAGSDADVTIDGKVTLDVAASSDAFLRGTASNRIDTSQFRINREQPDRTTALRGSFPFNGGAISLHSTGAPVNVTGVEIASRIGFISGGDNPAPFEQVTANSGRRWAASSAADVVIDGEVTLDVTAVGGSSLDGYAIKETAASRFNISEQPSTGPALQGTFPYRGGPITITPVDVPVSTAGIELKARTGTLTGGGNPAPFETQLANQPDQWTVGSLNQVTIDGPLTLDVSASTNATLSAFWGKWPKIHSIRSCSHKPSERLTWHLRFQRWTDHDPTSARCWPCDNQGLGLDCKSGKFDWRRKCGSVRNGHQQYSAAMGGHVIGRRHDRRCSHARRDRIGGRHDRCFGQHRQ